MGNEGYSAQSAAGWEDRPKTGDRLISLSVPAPHIAPLPFLRQSRGGERIYWADPATRSTWVGRGVAASLTAWGAGRFDSIAAQARHLFDGAWIESADSPAAPRLFGGFAFRDDFVPDNTWADFPAAWFVLPHWQLSHTPNGNALTLNVIAPPDEDPARLADGLRTLLRDLLADWDGREPADRPNPVTELRYPMSRPAWGEMIDRATAAIRAGELEKVVLSRVCELRFERQVEADRVLDHLDAIYNSSWRFLFEPQPFHAFLGATPELLVQVDGPHITTMAMAGSAPRGNSVAEDLELGNGLLHSDKNRHEHQIVVDEMVARLAPFSPDLTWPETPHLRKLHNIQHLCTPIAGQMPESADLLTVAELLHPTPALGGAPRDAALAWISAAETVPRGWYAAPIGMLDSRLQGTFAVAIRSAVTQLRRVWLHAGCGIVAGSDAQAEWDETELKFRPMLDGFAPNRPQA
jgi:menaquinone-specific isochorismate synthase